MRVDILSEFEITKVQFYNGDLRVSEELDVNDHPLILKKAKALKKARSGRMGFTKEALGKTQKVRRENSGCLMFYSQDSDEGPYYHLEAALGKDLFSLIDTRIPVPADPDDYELVGICGGEIKTHNILKGFGPVLKVIKAYIESGQLIAPKHHEWFENSEVDYR